MKNPGNGSIKNLRYLCLIGVIVLGLMTIVGTGGGGSNGSDGGGLDIRISDAELLYNDNELPFTMDGSFATLKKSSTELYFWHNYGNTTYKFHGPLDDPLQTQDWAKTNTELFDYNGKANPDKDYIWLVNIYKRDNGDLLGFCHIEKTVGGLGTDAEFAIGLIYSTNDGDYWTYCGEIIRPQKDTYNIGGVPYLVVGDSFFVYFNELPINSMDDRRISVARADVNDVLNAAAAGQVISWQKYNDGAWTQSGLFGLGSNIIPNWPWFDVHSDAAYNTAIEMYMLTVQTGTLGQLLLYTSRDGVNWGNKIIVDETDDNDFTTAYSCFASLSDATDDCREVGSQFYIIHPRKDWPDYYDYDELYRHLVTIE